jgi:type IV secretory pathway ATPase VirB11/archaellum biosynthesis ATPase
MGAHARTERGGTDYPVPAAAPPDDPGAWYAPDVVDQREVYPGVVTTVRRTGDAFAYEAREPSLPAGGRDALARVEAYFADATNDRPLTREGTRERMRAGFAPKYERAVDRLTDLQPALRRRLEYHALARVRALEELTPHALDDRIEVAEERERAGERELVVHTRDFAPAWTGMEASHLDRFAAERTARYTVSFLDFEVPVVRYRENVLGEDPFEAKYAVREPDLLPGDRALVEECKERVWEASVDGVLDGPGGDAYGEDYDERAAFVRERAERVLSRRLTARNTRAWVDTVRHRVREVLAEYGVALPPVDRRYAADRLDDLVYYVLRDYVGYGQLTVPIRDPHLEDVEANRVGERVKVVPRGAEERVPTNLAFEDETAFTNVVTQLAAADGVELNGSTPSAKVNLSPEGVDETIRCAVALPVVSEDGPHLSIRKQASDPLTPVDLVENGTLPTELVALLWLVYEHHGVVLFAGPTGVGKTTLMNAHVPFVGFDERIVSIDEGSREVRVPHETGVSLTTREHEHEYKRVTMSDLMTETNYLNPDVEVIAEINTPESFRTFGEAIQTGHGLVGTTHSEDFETLVNRVVEQGLPSYLLSEIDLVVFPRHVDDERYVGEVVEIVDESDAGPETDTVERGGTTVHYDLVCERTPDGAFDVAYDPEGDAPHLFESLAAGEDRRPDDVEREFRRKHRYVRYLVEEGVDDYDDFFAFLADLEANEAATVEREVGTGEREVGTGEREVGTGERDARPDG